MGSTPIGISGSRAAAVLGMSPWQTPFQVYQDIMEARQPSFNAAAGYDYTPFDGNAATRWGLAFEDAIIKLAEERGHNGNHHITDRERAFTVHDFITCHIDGMYQFNPRILHEGKTVNAFGFKDNWGDPGSDRIPIEYQIQVQHQMLCTGADECIVSVLVFPKRPDEWEQEGWLTGPNRIYIPSGIEDENYPHIALDPYRWATTLAQMGFFHQYIVKADPHLHALMKQTYKSWWETYVLGETPPDAVDYADIRAMITAPTGTIIVDADTARWFKEYKDIGSEIGTSGNLAKRRDQLKVLILDHARGLEATLDDDSTDKWIFLDDRGNKVGSYGRTAKGVMVFR